jgi:hypothetical protein
VTHPTTRTPPTASDKRADRRGYALGSEPDEGTPREPSAGPDPVSQVAVVGQVPREQRLADLRGALNAPAWAAAVAALQQEGGAP